MSRVIGVLLIVAIATSGCQPDTRADEVLDFAVDYAVAEAHQDWATEWAMSAEAQSLDPTVEAFVDRNERSLNQAGDWGLDPDVHTIDREIHSSGEEFGRRWWIVRIRYYDIPNPGTTEYAYRIEETDDGQLLITNDRL